MTAGQAAAPLEVREYEGEYGNRDHITRSELGMIPVSAIARLNGVRGERPGWSPWHRQGAEWEAFKDRLDLEGIKGHVFITVDPGEEPLISEGNQRRDAAVELGHVLVPAEIRYFGHAEREGTVLDRAIASRDAQLPEDREAG